MKNIIKAALIFAFCMSAATFIFFAAGMHWGTKEAGFWFFGCITMGGYISTWPLFFGKE